MLSLVIPKVQAWEQLNDPEYSGGLSMSRFHALLLEAGYDTKTAQKLACNRGWERLQAGVKM